MHVVKSEEHSEALRELVRGAKHSLEMVSPYVTLGPVEEIIRCLRLSRKGVVLTFTFAWPEPGSSPASIEPAALTQLLHAGHSVKFVHDPEQRLHGKVYVADDERALVTSANLTSRGFGGFGAGSKAAANLELGIMSSEPKVVGDVLSWIEGLPAEDLAPGHIEALADWRAQAFHELPDPPPPPLIKHSDIEAVVQVLSGARAKGVITSFEHVRTGLGRSAFHVSVRGVRGALTLRGRVSEQSADRGGAAYHFEITPGDQMRGGTDGYIFVPLDTQRRPLVDAPAVIVPYDRIVGRQRHQISLASLKQVHALRVNLRMANGVVTLGRPTGSGPFDLTGCCNETSAFREYYR
jgi:hypothetical protein